MIDADRSTLHDLAEEWRSLDRECHDTAPHRHDCRCRQCAAWESDHRREDQRS